MKKRKQKKKKTEKETEETEEAKLKKKTEKLSFFERDSRVALIITLPCFFFHVLYLPLHPLPMLLVPSTPPSLILTAGWLEGGGRGPAAADVLAARQEPRRGGRAPRSHRRKGAPDRKTSLCLFCYFFSRLHFFFPLVS